MPVMRAAVLLILDMILFFQIFSPLRSNIQVNLEILFDKLFQKRIFFQLLGDIVTHMPPARQRLGKHFLKTGIIGEAEVDLVGNGACFHGNEC
jgi:hypothetical protein